MKRNRNWLGGLGSLSPNCKEAARLQAKRAHQPLSVGEAAGLRIHLFLCKWCRRYESKLRFLLSAKPETPPAKDEAGAAELPADARERIRQALEKKPK